MHVAIWVLYFSALCSPHRLQSLETAVAAFGAMSLNMAAAWRIKYRDMKSSSGKVKVRVENMGVHDQNRSGVYPNGLRCKDLCENVLGAGFLKQEFSNMLVAVEEMPMAEIMKLDRSRGDFQTGSEYNKAASLKDDLLQTCFQEPYSNVQYKLLGNNHMMLTIRAFMTKAEWKLAPIEQKFLGKSIKACDENGKLCLTAVAATENGKELVQVINEGLDVEVLSYKMQVEEPSAAAVISAALNKCSDFAMKTTEWAALNTLRGEIIKASGEFGQRVAFQSIVDRVYVQLDSAALDPDLDQLFDFIIGVGAAQNSFFDELMDFQKIFVNSKKRQMRFAGFKVVNKLDPAFPRLKIAIIKRAYRKKATNGWIADPESIWTAIAGPILESAEQLLRYTHSDEKLSFTTHHAKSVCFGNVDIGIADALMSTIVEYKNKPSIDVAQKAMLTSVAKNLSDEQIRRCTEFTSVVGCEWIKFEVAPTQTAVAAATTLAGESNAKVRVLQFDEKTGVLLQKQVTFDEQDRSRGQTIEAPWKLWHEQNLNMGAKHADKACVITMLENIHRKWDVSSVDVKIMLKGDKSGTTKALVVAGAKVKKIHSFYRLASPGTVRWWISPKSILWLCQFQYVLQTTQTS